MSMPVSQLIAHATNAWLSESTLPLSNIKKKPGVFPQYQPDIDRISWSETRK